MSAHNERKGCCIFYVNTYNLQLLKFSNTCETKNMRSKDEHVFYSVTIKNMPVVEDDAVII